MKIGEGKDGSRKNVEDRASKDGEVGGRKVAEDGTKKDVEDEP